MTTRHDDLVTVWENADSANGELATVTVREQPGATVIVVTGEIDMSTAPLLENTVRDALTRPEDVLVVDLGAATFFSSAGMAVLLLAQQRCAEGRFRVVARDRIILHPLELAGLTEELSVHATVESALGR